VGANNQIAYVHFSSDEFDQGVSITRDSLDLVRDEAETGDRRAIEALPAMYQSYSAYLISAGKNEDALKAMRRSADLQISYTEKYEDENVDIKIAGHELNYEMMKAATGNTEGLDESLDAFMTMIEKKILEDPEKHDELLDDYLRGFGSVIGLYISDRFGLLSKEKALAPVIRADKFNAKMMKTEGKTHDRIHYDYYFAILRGD